MRNKTLSVVAFYQTNYPDDSSPMASRLHFYMRALYAAGADVKIIVPSSEIKQDKFIDGINYSYRLVDQKCLESNRNKHLTYSEIVRELSLKFDVVFISLSDDNATRFYTNAVKKVNGKLVVEMNENPYSIIGSRKDFKVILFFKRLFYLNFVLKKIDGVIVISKNLENLIERFKGKKTQIIRIPILSEKTQYVYNINRGIKDKYILHAGSLSEQKDGIKSMIKAFKIAKSELDFNLKFYFTQDKGLPNLLKWIRNFLTINKLENDIKFTGILNRKELDELYKNCSLAIVNKPINSQNNFNFSTKLTELIPRKIPLIISNTGEHSNYFIHNFNCYLVEPDNVIEMSKGIIKILTDSEYSNFITNNASSLIDNEFYYLNHSKSLFDFFLNIKKS